jgi:16S rRNA (cytidine1402-2'-O)-methyltransferase
MGKSGAHRTKRSKLYVVATPIGNLEDITLRALRVLKEVDLIAAEDTRHSRKLLTHYGIETSVTSYYDQIEREKAPQLIEELKKNKSIALISDAGTPCIADPGFRLVRAAIDAGIDVEVIPGPSAVAAALSVSGLPTDRFAFEGFIPAKATARRHFFEALVSEERTLVLYEAARRLINSLEDLRDILGDRQIVLARELTKLFEEVLRGPASEVADTLRQPASRERLQGEVTLIVAGAAKAAPALSIDDLGAEITKRRAAGASLKEVARQLADEHGLSRREVYQAGLKLDGSR